MTEGLKISVTGVDEILKRLDQLGPKMRRKVETDALKKGLEAVKNRAEELAPTGPAKGELKARIKNSFKFQRRTKKGAAFLRLVNQAPHAFLMEFGFYLTKSSSDGQKYQIKPIGSPYETGPRPFLRPAVSEKGEDVVEAMIEAARSAIREIEVK